MSIYALGESDAVAEIPMVERCELVGGPYDGFVLLPHQGGAISKWFYDQKNPEAFAGSYSLSGAPTVAMFHEIDLVWVDGPHGEAYYMMQDDVHWKAVDMEQVLEGD